MDLTKTQTITDVIHGSIEYNGIEAEIIGTPIFNRLHRVLQSSLVFQTYSSNKIKRFEHSVGVMDLAGRMFFYSVCNTTDSKILQGLLKDVEDAVLEWRRNDKYKHLLSMVPRNALSQHAGENIFKMPLPANGMYNRFFPKNIAGLGEKAIVSYYIAFQAIRIAGLLHDVGHMPYSHVFEHAINQLYDIVSKRPEEERNSNQNMFLDLMADYCNPPYGEETGTRGKNEELHEEIGKICADKIFECIAAVNRSSKNNIFFVAAYDFACKILQSTPEENNIYSDLHKIVAGLVDADRLDYCSRDAFCAGLRKDIINYDRLFSTYSICQIRSGKVPEKTVDAGRKERPRFYFCPNVKNVALIEDLLNRRWEIFSVINYHHRVHKHEVLFEEIIVDLGLEELASDKEIKELGQGSLPLRIFSIWQLISLLRDDQPPEYLLIQFDDSWLDTLLKRRFFERYQGDFMWSGERADDPVWYQYDELISSQKHYYSAFKRMEDFRLADKLLFEKVIEVVNNPDSSTKIPEKLRNKFLVDLDGIEDYNVFVVMKRTLFFQWLFKNTTLRVAVLPENRQELLKDIQEILKENLLTEGKVQDVLLRDCTFSLGCSNARDRLFVIDQGQPRQFSSYSNIEQSLKERRNLSLPVHLYYLPVSHSDDCPPDDSGIDKKEDIYSRFAEATWQAICKKVNTNFIKEEKTQ